MMDDTDRAIKRAMKSYWDEHSHFPGFNGKKSHKIGRKTRKRRPPERTFMEDFNEED